MAGTSLLLVVVLLMWRRVLPRRAWEGRCPHCRYDTGGLPLVRTRCPECGNNRWDQRAITKRGRRPVHAALLILAIAAGVLCVERLCHRDTRQAFALWTLPVRVTWMGDARLIEEVRRGPDVGYAGPTIAYEELMRRLDTHPPDTPRSRALRETVVRELGSSNTLGGVSMNALSFAFARRLHRWHREGTIGPNELRDFVLDGVSLRFLMMWVERVDGDGEMWQGYTRVYGGRAMPDAWRVLVRIRELRLLDEGGRQLWSWERAGDWSEGARTTYGTFSVGVPQDDLPDLVGERVRLRWDVEIEVYHGMAPDGGEKICAFRSADTGSLMRMRQAGLRSYNRLKSGAEENEP
jgi:hypothetical protein